MFTNLKKIHSIEKKDFKQLLPCCLSRDKEMFVTSCFIDNYDFFLNCLMIKNIYILEKYLILLKRLLELKEIREYSEENGIWYYLEQCFEFVSMYSNNSNLYITLCKIIQLFESLHIEIEDYMQENLLFSFLSDQSLDLKIAIISIFSNKNFKFEPFIIQKIIYSAFTFFIENSENLIVSDKLLLFFEQNLLQFIEIKNYFKIIISNMSLTSVSFNINSFKLFNKIVRHQRGIEISIEENILKKIVLILSDGTFKERIEIIILIDNLLFYNQPNFPDSIFRITQTLDFMLPFIEYGVVNSYSVIFYYFYRYDNNEFCQLLIQNSESLIRDLIVNYDNIMFSNEFSERLKFFAKKIMIIIEVNEIFTD